MSSTPGATEAGLPSLLIEAARSAAVADGLLPPSDNRLKNDDDSDSATVMDMAASCSGSANNSATFSQVQKNLSVGVSALDQARSAITAALQQKHNIVPNNHQPPAATIAAQLKSINSTTVGSSAHMLAAAAANNSSKQSPAQHSSTASPVARSGSAGGGSSAGGGKKKGPPLRRGKWTSEEEAYANRLILEFKAGLLPLTDGTTLRTFLSKLLNCDPMRISKKFVGSNCIGKQVFRRRTAEINRLTPEQIQQSRSELSDLERRFLERVAQTNRVKSSGVGGTTSATCSVPGAGSSPAPAVPSGPLKIKIEEREDSGRNTPPSPPWLRPPNGFKPGTGAATAAAALSGGTINRAAAAGRALLQSSNALRSALDQKSSRGSTGSNGSHGSAGLLSMAELQRRSSQQSLLQNAAAGLMGSRSSAGNLLTAATATNNENANSSGSSSGLSGTAMAQIARNASAMRMAGLAAAGNSVNNFLLKTGLSRDQLSQLAREHQLNSSSSLSNMMERQSSFDALMSLDFQSLQSIDNLANLIQTGGGLSGQIPKIGMKNWSSDGTGNSSNNLAAALGSSGNLANARRLASEGRMESLIRSLSSGNVVNKLNNNGGSNANFNNLLQSMQNNLNGAGTGNSAASAFNLANMLRVDSSTGLTNLRMQDGLAPRNSSVDDFLSLVASGDIPHQDPHTLNVPLQSVMQQQQNNQSGAQAAATYLAQQQLLAQAANCSNGGFLGQRIASLSGLANNSSAASLLSQFAASQGNSAAAVAFTQQQQQARAAQLNLHASAFVAARTQQQNSSSSSLKRKHLGHGSSDNFDEQGSSKR